MSEQELKDSFKTGVISLGDIEMQTSDTVVPINEGSDKHDITHFYEDVFRVTLSEGLCCDKDGPPSLVFLNDVHIALRYQKDLDDACIHRAVFERLLLENPSQHLVQRKHFDSDDQIACEKKIIFYFYQSYHRLKQYAHFKLAPVATAHHVIISQTATALCNPEMYPDAELSEDLMKLLLYYHDQAGHCDILSQFLVDVASFLTDGQSANLATVLKDSFNFLQQKFMMTSLSDANLCIYIDILNYFMGSENLVKALLKHSMPAEIKNGKAYQNSLIGVPLSVSCLPRSEVERFEYFQDAERQSSHSHNVEQEYLRMPLNAIVKRMYGLFNVILRKSLDCREMFLQWLGNCLDANLGRERISNSQFPEMYSSLHASDGFFLNLTAVLLLLCKPFAEPCSPKLFKVDPLYVTAPVSTESNQNGVHIKSLSKETCLVPRDDSMAVDHACKFNFITECFFATHYALRLGFHAICEKVIALDEELARLETLQSTARERQLPSAERITESLKKALSKYLTYCTALFVPETVNMLLKFQAATATFLVNSATDSSLSLFKTLKFPPPSETSHILSYIPEFILENIIDACTAVKRYTPTGQQSLEMLGPDLDHFMTLILMFMGSRERVVNPHLRAHLAEMMGCLSPVSKDPVVVSREFRTKLFTSHAFVEELIPTILNVFVSIEITGQNVQFHQKFQYRQPMFRVLSYIWQFDVHKRKMKALAEEAERNIESPQPPLFLHFINLLINDAIYLLDEALSFMSQLREIQQSIDNGSRASLSVEQQTREESNFRHIGNLARFHNMLSNITIQALQWLTTEIKSIFCHPSIVERITAMLNYFLLHLVGPQKKNFKVKDMKEYKFKPQELVYTICHIYCNLGASDDAYAEMFRSAVSRDGRSYNRDLFPLAQTVLNKIGHGVLASQLEIIANKVHLLAVKQQQDDEMSSEAPEEFFDPIMNTIMKDPVKLPTSGVIIDRATIVRHLLSDQTDPFNRSPLTMDMVIPDEALKAKIEKWFQERNRE